MQSDHLSFLTALFNPFTFNVPIYVMFKIYLAIFFPFVLSVVSFSILLLLFSFGFIENLLIFHLFLVYLNYFCFIIFSGHSRTHNIHL